MTPAERKLRNARAVVVQAHPFFGALLLRQRVVEHPECETVATDGDTLYFNAAFVESCSPEDLHFICAHEALHPGLCHHLRRGARDHELWNQACDYAINPILVEAGLRAPPKVFIRPDLTALGQAERIYAKLVSELPPPPPPQPQDGGGDEQGSAGDDGGSGEAGDQRPEQSAEDEPKGGQEMPDTGGTGCVLDCPKATNDAERQAEEAQWKVTLAQAQMAAGVLPGGLERAVRELLEPRAPWRDLLRRFASQLDRADYSWRSPNRRFVDQGLYLPALHSEKLPPVAFVIDASGSMPKESLAQALSEVQAIVSELRPERLDVVVHGSIVCGTRSFEPDEPVEMAVRAGGGTLFTPVCDWIAEQPDEYACVIWFTDMMPADWGRAASRAPSCPVLFVDYGDTQIPPGFGEAEVIRMPREVTP